MVAERSERHESTIRPSGARAVALSGTHRDEWEHLPARDQALLTGEVLSRWTVALDDDEYSLAEVVRLERQRRASLATLRQGVALTDREFAIVRLLQRHEGRTVTFVEMVRTLWPDETRRANARDLWDRNGAFARHVRSMHVVLYLLRQKLEVDPLRPQHIVSIRSVGYRWYSLPPSADDGEDYAARADDARALRYEIRGYRGELPAPREPSGRFRLGPNHPDYAIVEAQVVERRSRERD
jgi:DNA-binding winged helix-turn-helix (wHTH) protein